MNDIGENKGHTKVDVLSVPVQHEAPKPTQNTLLQASLG